MPTDKYLSRQTDLNRQARQLLIDLLAGGPQPYSTIHERAQETGDSSLDAPDCEASA